MEPVNAIYGNHYHVYEDLYGNNIWNSYRGSRFVVHEMIVGYLAKLQQQGRTHEQDTMLLEHSRLASRSQATLKELSKDICASVPYHFGTTAAWKALRTLSITISTTLNTVLWREGMGSRTWNDTDMEVDVGPIPQLPAIMMVVMGYLIIKVTF